MIDEYIKLRDEITRLNTEEDRIITLAVKDTNWTTPVGEETNLYYETEVLITETIDGETEEIFSFTFTSEKLEDLDDIFDWMLEEAYNALT